MTEADPAPKAGTVGTTPPTLALISVMDAVGIWPSGSYAENSVGILHQFACDYEPYAQPAADGRQLPAAIRPGLGTFFGHAYGVGDDGDSFILPDLRGRAAVGSSATAPVGTAGGQTLAVTYMIAANAIFPSGDGAPMISQVVAYAGGEVPGGWLPCDGRLLAIPDYTALFGLLGTAFGGDGMTDFALPDLRGRAPVGIGSLPDSSYLYLGTQVGETGLGLNYLFCSEGPYPVREGGSGFWNELTLGEIVAMATLSGVLGNGPLLPADGRLLQVADYPDLNAAIGNLYGGDGVTTFALPDLRGRMIVGATPSPGGGR